MGRTAKAGGSARELGREGWYGRQEKKEWGTGVLNEREVGKLLEGDHVTTVPHNSQWKKH